MQPLALAHRPFQRHLALEAGEAHGASLAVNLAHLGAYPRHAGGIAEHLKAHPACQHRAGVLAGEQDRQQYAGHLVVAQRPAVLVAGLHQRLHEILRRGARTPPTLHDSDKNPGYPAARAVATPMRRDR